MQSIGGCYSEGVEEVVEESIAYIYVKFFFDPKPAEGRHVAHDAAQAVFDLYSCRSRLARP